MKYFCDGHHESMFTVVFAANFVSATKLLLTPRGPDLRDLGAGPSAPPQEILMI